MPKISYLRSQINSFLKSERDFPVIAAIASGLYPLLYVYYSNFTLVSSWSQFAFYVCFLLILPVIFFKLIILLSQRISILRKYRHFLIPVLNICAFIFFMVMITYGFKKKILAVALLIAVLIAIAVYRHIKKIIVLQFLMAIIALFMLIPVLFLPFKVSSEWMQQPDDIIEVQFKKRPNVYIIQPDGYANFSELKKMPYGYDNSAFENFLTQNNFKLYPNFRSNYFSTLSSNSSMFAMKHHYYNNVKGSVHEFFNAREIIVGDNPVVSIFKNNNYKTFLMLHKSYLLTNRATIKYDYCNIDYSEVPYFTKGFGVTKDLETDLELAIKNNPQTSNFYFIEQISPGHISTFKTNTEGKIKEREDYIEKLDGANSWLKNMVDIINAKDKDALIVIIADHGGFVGFDYTLQSKHKQNDNDLVKSVFTSALAIKWPNGNVPKYDNELKTNVNLFRVLFSYLEENEAYLEHLEDDKSYLMIDEGAPNGVYEVMDDNNEHVFKSVSN